jgi:hypothetical protein
MSPLHHAASVDGIAAIRFLLEKGANIELDLGENGTPLCVASRTFQSRRCAVLLLIEGAKLFCCNAKGDGYNVLHNSIAIPDVFMKGDQELSLTRTLIEAIPARIFDERHHLVNSKNLLGCTPIHMAVWCCDIKTVELLVEIGGTDLSIEDPSGRTPLMIAIFRKQYVQEDADGYAKWLKERGAANPPAKLHDQRWMKQRYDKIAEILLDAGSPVPERDEGTGEYMFLLMQAAFDAFRHTSGDNFAQKIQELFGTFECKTYRKSKYTLTD